MLKKFEISEKAELNKLASEFYLAKQKHRKDEEESILQELSILLYRFLAYYAKSDGFDKFVREDFISYSYVKIIEKLKENKLDENVNLDFCRYAYSCMKNYRRNYCRDHKDKICDHSLDENVFVDGEESRLDFMIDPNTEDIMGNIYMEHILKSVMELVKGDTKKEILNYYFIEKIMKRNITLKELANIMNVSPSYVTRVTKEFDILIREIIQEEDL
ncbi:MAG: hypothetical protein RSC10_00520 [Longicatena sp.]